jgi:hypothetical protein
MRVEKAYRNIEAIITFGFLHKGLRYKNNIIILKTITDKEYQLIPFYTTYENLDSVLYRLAFSTFMINGYNFLVDRNETIPELFSFYNELSTVSLNKIMDASNKVYNEYIESLEFLEGFCYTDRSRALWKILSGKDVTTKGSYYGIQGTENLGLNSAQESWIVINRQLDSEEDYNTQFRLSLMIASSFSGKGAQKIENSYEAHLKELEELRADIAKYGHDRNRWINQQKERNGWGYIAKTREDLVRELNREMSGDKDKHDAYIESWIQKQKNQAELAEKEAERKRKEFRNKLNNDINFSKIEYSRAATAEEIANLDKKRVIPGTAKATDPLERGRRSEDVLKKFGSTVIGGITMKPGDQRLVRQG